MHGHLKAVEQGCLKGTRGSLARGDGGQGTSPTSVAMSYRIDNFYWLATMDRWKVFSKIVKDVTQEAIGWE